MTDFVVVVSAVQQAAQASSSMSAELQAELAGLRREAQALLSAGWLGRAAEYFDRTWTEWDLAARELLTVLDELAEGLAASGHAYEAQDSTGSHLLALAAS